MTEKLISFLLFIVLAASFISAGEASFIEKPDHIYLKNGKMIKGNIIAAGPKGIVIIVEDSNKLQNFISRDQIKKIKRFKPDTNQGFTTNDMIKKYYVKAEEGSLTLTTEKPEKIDTPATKKKKIKKKPKKKKNRSSLPPLLNPRRSLKEDKKKKSKNDKKELFESGEGEDDKENKSKDKEDSPEFDGNSEFDKLLD